MDILFTVSFRSKKQTVKPVNKRHELLLGMVGSNLVMVEVLAASVLASACFTHDP